MRDRLMAILRLMPATSSTIDGQGKIRSFTSFSDLADYLIAHGVIVPPCKVGDTVWFNTFKKNATVCVGVQPHKIDRIDISFVCDTKNLIETHIHDWEIGKTVFLTREEAEKALAERSGE